MPLISVTTLATNGGNKMYSVAPIQVSNCNLHDEFVTALPSYYSVTISRSHFFFFFKKQKQEQRDIVSTGTHTKTLTKQIFHVNLE